MTDAEKTLDAFFADDGLPARDQAFTHAVMRKAAARRLRNDLLSLAGLCLLAGLVLWSVSPGLARLLGWSLGVIEAAGPVLGILGLVATVLFFTTPRAPVEEGVSA